MGILVALGYHVGLLFVRNSSCSTSTGILFYIVIVFHNIRSEIEIFSPLRVIQCAIFAQYQCMPYVLPVPNMLEKICSSF